MVRRVAVLLSELRRLVLPVLGNATVTGRLLFLLCVALLRRRDDRGIDNLAAHRQETRSPQKLVEAPGFTGNAPGGPSRWNTERTTQWQPLKPKLVVEVRYDQVTGRRFRHGTALLRWRPDKAPAQCTMDQLVHELRPAELATITG